MPLPASTRVAGRAHLWAITALVAAALWSGPLPVACSDVAINDRIGAVVRDRYIVVFKREAGDAHAAADMLVNQVSSVLDRLRQSSIFQGAPQAAATQPQQLLLSRAAATAGGEAAPLTGLRIVRRLGGTGTPGRAATATSKTAAATAANPTEAAADEGSSSLKGTSGLQAVVVEAPAQAVPHIRSSQLVASVIPDRVTGVMGRRCTNTEALFEGISASHSPEFTWPGCLTANARLVWRGRACKTDAGKVTYTRVRAVDMDTNKVITAPNGEPCVLRRDTDRPAFTQQRLGGCGEPPEYATSLPTTLCSTASRTNYLPPDTTIRTTPDAPSVLDRHYNVFSKALPKVEVKASEVVPSGVVRIEAATKLGVADTSNTRGKQVVVGIVDSGVDASHPDIRLVGGRSWSMLSLNLPDTVDPDKDLYGHGTAMAGIVGALNNGAGPLATSVVGVAPGTPVFSLKVLDAEGRGTLADALEAVKWAIGPEGQAMGIKVLNLSLATKIALDDEYYEATMELVCPVFQEASDAGVFVAAAAGNEGESLQQFLPAACPAVAAVTSLDVRNNVPSSFSNWLPANAPASERASVIAAPGGSIVSTMSFAKDPSGYRQLSGTSMACPHVAAVAATCIMSGACPAGSTGLDMLATIQAAAKERLSLPNAPAYGFPGDASSTEGHRYYGNLVWAKY